MNRMMEYDKDKLDDALLKKIGKFTSNPGFTGDAVGKVCMIFFALLHTFINACTP